MGKNGARPHFLILLFWIELFVEKNGAIEKNKNGARPHFLIIPYNVGDLLFLCDFSCSGFCCTVFLVGAFLVGA